MTHKNTKPGAGLVLEKEQATEYGRRGGLRRRSDHVTRVEGEYVTTTQIAARLGTAVGTAQKRLKRAREGAGDVTWKALGVKT